MFYFKNIPLKRKTYLERHKKNKMEDSRGEIIFSEGHLINIPLYSNVPLKKLSHPYYPSFWFFYASQGKFSF